MFIHEPEPKIVNNFDLQIHSYQPHAVHGKDFPQFVHIGSLARVQDMFRQMCSLALAQVSHRLHELDPARKHWQYVGHSGLADATEFELLYSAVAYETHPLSIQAQERVLTTDTPQSWAVVAGEVFIKTSLERLHSLVLLDKDPRMIPHGLQWTTMLQFVQNGLILLASQGMELPNQGEFERFIESLSSSMGLFRIGTEPKA